jgi:AmiR/NasT family two-component response regulator
MASDVPMQDFEVDDDRSVATGRELLDLAERVQAASASLRVHNAATMAKAEQVLAEAAALPHDRVSALREELAGLRLALESRAVIEQAKGVLMATAGCTAEEAFALLRRQSQHENRKLRDVAEQLVRDQHRRGRQ